jgi:hypothetical protein
MLHAVETYLTLRRATGFAMLNAEGPCAHASRRLS